MKALLASAVLLFSSMSFAQFEGLEDTATLIYSCAIEKYCVPGTETPFDLNFTANKANASAALGISCMDIDFLMGMPEVAAGVKEFANGVTAIGETTCLSTIP